MDSQNNKSIIQFTNPELVESIFMENPNYKGSLDISQNMMISTNHSDIQIESKFNKSSIVSLTVSNFNQINMNSNKPFFIRQTMKAKFIWKKGLSTEEEEDLLKVNAALYFCPISDHKFVVLPHFLNFVNRIYRL